MKAIISGAGIAGLALAQRLATAGWDVTVIERSPVPRDQGYLRPDLALAFREQLTSNVDLRFGCSITHIENSAESVAVTLTDDTVLDADLLVGADGVHSAVRRMMFGEENRFFRYLGYHTAADVYYDRVALPHWRSPEGTCAAHSSRVRTRSTPRRPLPSRCPSRERTRGLGGRYCPRAGV